MKQSWLKVAENQLSTMAESTVSCTMRNILQFLTWLYINYSLIVSFTLDYILAKIFQLRYTLAKNVLARVHPSYSYTLAITYYKYIYTALRNKVHNDTSLLIDMVTLLVVTHDFTSSTQSNEKDTCNSW